MKYNALQIDSPFWKHFFD